MDYEKAYKEALKRAKELLDLNPSDDGIRRWVQDTFPELKESKDEIARKWLIEILKEHTQHDEPCIAKDALVWLEKQGEQKVNAANISIQNI